MTAAFLAYARFQSLLDALTARGFRVVGPTVRDGAIVYDTLATLDALPKGIEVEQGPGQYRLRHAAHTRYFAWANGPQALKPLVFSARETLWRAARAGNGAIRFMEPDTPAESLAVIGVRGCDLAALALQDQHFLDGEYPDPHYAARRRALFLVAVHCTAPAATCFCASTGDGPRAQSHFDLALSELDDGFLVEAGSARGMVILKQLPTRPTSAAEHDAAARAIEQAAVQQRRLPSRNLRDALLAQLEHPRWEQVAGRCLACGNCTAVCPTCFCHAESESAPTPTTGRTSEASRASDSARGPRLPDEVEGPETGTSRVGTRLGPIAESESAPSMALGPRLGPIAEVEVAQLDGSQSEHVREWDSCFTPMHSYIHGLTIRADRRARYRQWLTHKLGSWHDQYGRSGCVGCGRCITWCPVGIDITEEAAAVCGEGA